MALTNSRGVGRAIFFEGLEKPMVIAPALIDAPLLTAQPAYFLSLQDCLAMIRFSDDELDYYKAHGTLEILLETVCDNYLFALSKTDPQLRLTSKVQELVLRSDMTDQLHFGFDHHLTECLALDPLND